MTTEFNMPHVEQNESFESTMEEIISEIDQLYNDIDSSSSEEVRIKLTEMVQRLKQSNLTQIQGINHEFSPSLFNILESMCEKYRAGDDGVPKMVFSKVVEKALGI